MANLIGAVKEANNLSIEAGYVTKDNIEIFIQKAVRQSKSLSIESEFITTETAGDILAKGMAQASSVAGAANYESQ